MFLINKKICIKGGDTEIERYLIHYQTSGVKDCSLGGFKFHTLCIKEDFVQQLKETKAVRKDQISLKDGGVIK
jgi:hypothetical protein